MKIVGIDIGTTSICGVLIDAVSGKLLKSITKNSDAFIKTDNDWEKIQSPQIIVDKAICILNELVDDDCAAIGVTGQMHGIVYYDNTGNAVSPLYTWQDGRGNQPYKNTTYAKYLNSYSGYGNITDFYNRTNGLILNSAVGFCTIHDYFVMKLSNTMQPTIHSTNAASFGLYDLSSNAFSIKNGIKTVNDYCIAGYYKNIPVSVAIGDNQASVFSTLTDENKILLNVGTGSQISVVSENIIEAENIETRPYFDGKYLIVGAALCGGRAYSTLKNFYFEIIKLFKEDISDDDIYSAMDKALTDKPVTSLNVDTRFDGSRANPEIRGSITNLSENNFTFSDMTSGVLNGIVEELHNMFNIMSVCKSGLVGSGNGIRKNKHLIRIAERVFNSDMIIPIHTEEAAFGAAMFAAISANVFKNYRDAQSIIKFEKHKV